MKSYSLIFLLAILLNGCGEPPAVKFVSEKTEFLRENRFEIQYPADWEVSGTEDDISSDKKSTYFFVHPQNKKCRIIIDRFLIPANDDGSLVSFTKMAAEKIREFKDQFSKTGYKDFSFSKTESAWIGRGATKLVIKGTRGDVTRELTTYLIARDNYFYAVSYDWFSNWNSQARSRVIQAVNSFAFIH